MRPTTHHATSFLAFVTALVVGMAGAAGAEETEPREEATVISQKDKVFAPTEITVEKGSGLVFRNDDPVTHNVFSRSEGNQFNLKMQKPGQEDLVTFDEPGEVVVRCAIHPTMKLTIHVEDGDGHGDGTGAAKRAEQD